MSRDMNEQALRRGGVWGPPSSGSLQRLPPARPRKRRRMEWAERGQSRGDDGNQVRGRSAAGPNSRKKPAQPRAVSFFSLPSPSYKYAPPRKQRRKSKREEKEAEPREEGVRAGGGGGRGDEMMMTSGATGRIVPVFRSVLSRRALLRVAVALHSLFLWLLLLARGLRLRRAGSGADASALEAGAGGGSWNARRWRRLQAAEEEDVRRRRELAEEVPMEEDRATRWATFLVTGARRNALFCRLWAPAADEMRGILVIIHGLNEHSGRYLHFAEQLTACGFGVYAMDWIGHGGSDGLHGYVPSLDYVIEDIEVLLDKIMMENPGVPCFLLGHSTGGAVVLKASLYPHIREKLEGIILTSPALRVKPAHPIVGAVAPIFSLVAPKFQFKGANKRGIPVSRDPAALLAKYSDPLVYTGPIRVRTGHEILRISSYLLHSLKKVTVPFMVLHGTADRVTDPLASRELYGAAASRHKDLRLYDGFLHDLLFEPERDEVGAEIIGWMDGMLRLRRQTG